MDAVELHPKMVDRLARRYIEEYNKGGPKAAASFADKVLVSAEAKRKVRAAVGKRLEDAVT